VLLEGDVEAAWLHHRFVRIHPFQDGNGRMARLLMAYVFAGNREFPPVILEGRAAPGPGSPSAPRTSAPPGRRDRQRLADYGADFRPAVACFLAIFAQVSRRPTVRLTTSASGAESGSTQKYPTRSNW